MLLETIVLNKMIILGCQLLKKKKKFQKGFRKYCIYIITFELGKFFVFTSVRPSAQISFRFASVYRDYISSGLP